MPTSASFTPAADAPCYPVTQTRASAQALAAGGLLRENCVVTIPGPVIGTAGNQSATFITLQPVSPTQFADEALVNTAFSLNAWQGAYEIDTDVLSQLTDDFGNSAKDIDGTFDTVATQVPWHLGGPFFRDNYFEDAVLTAWDTQGAPATAMSGNTVRDSTVNLTGKLNGSFLNNEFIATTVTSGAQAFMTISQSKVRAGNLNFGAGAATGNVSVTRANLDQVTLTKDATATGGVTLTNANIESTAITQGAGSTGAITINDSDVRGGSAFNVDPGSAKSISVLQSETLGYTIRTQDAGAGSASLSRTYAQSKPSAALADSLLIRGATGSSGITISGSTINGQSVAPAGDASININASLQSHIISDSFIYNSRINVGPGAGAFQATGMRLDTSFINALSSTGARLTINYAEINGVSTVTHAAAATGGMSITSGNIDNGSLVELTSGDRALAVQGCTIVNGQVRQTSVNAAAAAGPNQVRDCRIIDGGRVILADTAPAGGAPNSVNRSTIKGSSLGGGVDGVLTIDGTSASVITDALEIEGVCTITNVPSGALSSGTSFHDIKVGPASTLTYSGGDATAKQIRNLVIQGLSSLTLTGLTGSAGAGLADVFAGRVANQSTMTVTGARVAGQPVRNFDVENGSNLNVAASGTVLQCSVRNGATLNTGAFRHSESIIEGAITKTATAANVNKLANKSFDDWI